MKIPPFCSGLARLVQQGILLHYNKFYVTRKACCKEREVGMKLFIGFVGSLLIAIVAYRKRSLSASGAVAVVIIGTLIYALSDIKWYGVLLAFFISSSLLSHRKKEAKQEVESLFAKTGTRDFMQVFANGGAGLVAILGAFIAAMEEGWYAFYIGSIAAVTADTWATEIGVLAKGKPRHIFTWRKVDPGTSGGVSGAGLAASFAGGTFIGGCACLFSLLAQEGVNVHYVVAGAVGGMIGSLIDSAVGAAWSLPGRNVPGISSSISTVVNAFSSFFPATNV
jgi:uncharacterized protein (TIGR00297 family)